LTKSECEQESPFCEISWSFTRNIAAVRVFLEDIGRVAHKHDNKVTGDLLAPFLDLIGANPDNATQFVEGDYLDASGRPAPLPEWVKGLGTRTELKTLSEEEQLAMRAKAQKMMKDDPELAERWGRSILSAVGSSFDQGKLLRRSGLISLTIYFEALVSDLLHRFYGLHPKALPSESKVLSLEDLWAAGSIEEAERVLIERESDAVLRKPIEQQLEYFRDRPSIPLDSVSTYTDELVEVFLRRNVVVHNRGIVNRDYLSRLPSSLATEHKPSLGDQLRIGPSYLLLALETVFICGFGLLQECWRKWDPEKAPEADRHLLMAVNAAMDGDRAPRVCLLGDIASRLGVGTERVRRDLAIQHCIALRELGHSDEVEEALELANWDSAPLRYQLALCALRGDEDRLLELLPTAAAQGAVTSGTLRRSRLYKELRASTRFAAAVSELFPDVELHKVDAGNSGIH